MQAIARVFRIAFNSCLQLTNGIFREILPKIDVPERIGHIGIIRNALFRPFSVRHRLIEILITLGVQKGQIVQRKHIIRINTERLIIGVTRLIGVSHHLEDHSAIEQRFRVARARF